MFRFKELTVLVLALALMPNLSALAASKDEPTEHQRQAGKQPQAQKRDSTTSQSKTSGNPDMEELMTQLEPGKDTDFYQKEVKAAGYNIVSITHTVEKDGEMVEVELELDEQTGKVANVRIHPASEERTAMSGTAPGRQQRSSDRMAAAKGRSADQDATAKAGSDSKQAQDTHRTAPRRKAGDENKMSDRRDQQGVEQRMAASDKKAKGRDVSSAKSGKEDATDARQFSDRYQEEQLIEGVRTLPLADMNLFTEELEKRGYEIAKREENKGRLEIDAVKHGRVLTVTVDVDKKTGEATKIQASDLRWESEEVERSMTGRGSEAWSAGQAELNNALAPGKPRDFYRKTLDKLGYDITSVNYDQQDYVEYEVVKGNNSYEVKIDFDNGRQATEVEVDPNWWKARNTKEAMNRKR